MKTKNLFSMLLMIAALFFLTACDDDVDDDDVMEDAAVEESAEVDDAAVRAEIEQLEANYETAANNKDVEGVVAYYAEDAVSYPPNAEARVGKNSIRERIKKNMEADTANTKVKFQVQDVWTGGDIAVEVGTWTDMDASGNVIDNGRYMTLFEKRDGKYIAIRDIYSSAKPRK